MAGAAVAGLAAGLGPDVVLAWVSERIAADLRNETYRPFAEAVARILRRQADRRSDLADWHDTDRICYFLSVNLVDFAADC